MNPAVPRHAALLALLAGLAACSGGRHDAPAPAVIDFSADTLAVEAGRPAQLHWNVRGAVKVSIDPAVGTVQQTGSMQVAPGITTAYTLTARDAQGHTAHASVTVNVHQPPEPARSYPILFVTQVPLSTDEAARLSAFANHLPGIEAVPRGGDLMLRYPDGSLRNLTREAGFADNVAVREPASDWDGSRAVFSMLAGAGPSSFWQLYEVTGLGKGEHARITRVPGQPGDANNVSPLYATDGRILFTSDRPRAGLPHLYPQLDEYEATPTTTGIWSLDRRTGTLRILNHTPSGAFSPFIDSYGRVVFTRWDHLQQDQLAQRDRDATGNHVAVPFGSFNYAGEAKGAVPLPTRAELFPESRSGSRSKYGAVSAFANNFFTVWQMNEDGSGEETLNHVGQHELAFGFLTPSFRDDPALANRTVDSLHANLTSVRREGGLFQLREDPRRPGTYLATVARDRGTYGTGQLVRLAGGPDLNGEQMTVEPITPGDSGDALPGGRWRNPLALADGSLVASHAPDERAPPAGQGLHGLRLVKLERGPKTRLYRAGSPLTAGIRKTLSWHTAAELRPRPRPVRAQAGLEAPERAVLSEEKVSEDELRDWLVRNDLALIVTRDQTTRDRADLQQPFNLHVPGGVTTLSARAPDAKVYEIAHFQLFEGEQLRAYPRRPGRRMIAQPLDEGRNPANPGGPAGSVRIASDGSTAAFVPARRALSWQSTDRSGEAVVRERNWITFQAGEMRVCASCHGVNTHDQAGRPPPLNKPEALRTLLSWWKTQPR
jgi:hypothetical protein